MHTYGNPVARWRLRTIMRLIMHKNRAGLVVFLSLLAVVVLAGCGRDKEATPASAAQADVATAIPAPPAPEAAAQASAPDSPLVATGASPLATPVAGSPMPTPTVEETGMTGEPTAATGAIVGRILISRDGVDIPVGNLTIGLADVIRDENGVPKASGYAPETPNKAATNDEGGFAINNVPVGTYSLILDAVITSYQLDDPLTAETILVDVLAGETVDIGVLRYPSLPIPGFGTAN